METTRTSGDVHMRLSVDAMLSSTSDERGTVRALSRDIEEAHVDRKSLPYLPRHLLITMIGGIIYRFSDKFVERFTSPHLYQTLISYLRMALPTVLLRSHVWDGPGIAIPRQVAFFEWIVIRGQRYSIRSQTSNSTNAMVAIRSHDFSYKVARLEHLIVFCWDVPQLPIVRLAVVHYVDPVHEPLPLVSHWRSAYVGFLLANSHLRLLQLYRSYSYMAIPRVFRRHLPHRPRRHH
jgi:hypothetical protein